MPDWFTHSLIAWITGKTTKQDVALLVIGSLLPDLDKINIVFTSLGLGYYHSFEPLHTPVGACLIAGVIALFFQESKKAFIPLGIGIFTHFTLDFFLHVYAHGGMKLLFPFSWEEWQVYLIRSDEYMVTVVAVLAALLVYAVYWYSEKRKNSSPH